MAKRKPKATPRLVVPGDIPAVGRAVWFTAYDFNNDSTFPRNCHFDKTFSGKRLFHYTAGNPDGDAAAIVAAVDNVKAQIAAGTLEDRPVAAYVPHGVAFPANADWIAVECYWKLPLGETLAAFESSRQARVVAAARPVVIVGQAYFSNANNAGYTDHSEIQLVVPVFARLLRDYPSIVSFAAFSAGSWRATGYDDPALHPLLAPLYEQMALSITAPPEPGGPTPIPPVEPPGPIPITPPAPLAPPPPRVAHAEVKRIPRQYPHVDDITDWRAQQTARLLWDRTFELEERLQASEKTQRDLVSVTNDQDTQIAEAKAIGRDSLAQSQITASERSELATGSEVSLPGGGDGGLGAAGCAAAGANGHSAAPGHTAEEAGKIVCGTGNEFSALKAVTSDLATREANVVQLLRRMIWHLQQAGFTAGRQKNPSGAISNDKLCVIVDGTTRVYDVFSDWDNFANPVGTQMNETAPANLQADSGIAD